MSIFRAGRNKVLQKQDTKEKERKLKDSPTYIPPQKKKKKTGRAKMREQFDRSCQPQQKHLNRDKRKAEQTLGMGLQNLGDPRKVRGPNFGLPVATILDWRPNRHFTPEDYMYDPKLPLKWHYNRTHHQDTQRCQRKVHLARKGGDFLNGRVDCLMDKFMPEPLTQFLFREKPHRNRILGRQFAVCHDRTRRAIDYADWHYSSSSDDDY